MKKEMVAAKAKNSIQGQVPDEADKKNIQTLIRTYKKTFPYPHEESLKLAMEEGRKMTSRKMTYEELTKLTEKTGKPTLIYHLPIPFMDALKEAYPRIFTDPIQSKWFRENFPNLTLVKVEKPQKATE